MMESGILKKIDEDLINEIDSKKHDAEVAEVKNELNKYLAELKIKIAYNTLFMFGVPPMLKYLMYKKNVAARLIMAGRAFTYCHREKDNDL